MSKKDEALKLALEALRDYRRSDDDRVSVAMGILQDALAEQPAQPSKPWVGLTSEERDAILNREFKQWWSRHDAVCRAIEAKLKDKNGYWY